MNSNKFELIGKVNWFEYNQEKGLTKVLIGRGNKEKGFKSFSIVLFKENAQIFNTNIKKGDYIWISGQLSPNEYTNKEGEKISSLQLIANDFSKAKWNDETHQYESASDLVVSFSEVEEEINPDEIPF